VKNAINKVEIFAKFSRADCDAIGARRRIHIRSSSSGMEGYPTQLVFVSQDFLFMIAVVE
jgi:hypothetical protein